MANRGPGRWSYYEYKWCKPCEQRKPLAFNRCDKCNTKLRTTPRCRKSKKARLELVVRY